MEAWTDGFTIATGRTTARVPASIDVRLGGRLIRPLALAGGGPVRLRVDLGRAQPAALAPRARDGARTASEVGDHAARAAAGHTLPRLMGSLARISCAFVFSCHEPMRLALGA